MASPLKAVSAILFSLGSVMVIAELFVSVIVRERDATDSIVPSHWSVIGLCGLLGWVVGAGLLIYLKAATPGLKKDRKNIFLAGKRSFKCLSCGRTIDASRVGFQSKVECPCGSIYNVFQETEWEKQH